MSLFVYLVLGALTATVIVGLSTDVRAAARRLLRPIASADEASRTKLGREKVGSGVTRAK